MLEGSLIVRTMSNADVTVLSSGSWINHLRFETAAGPREFVERQNGLFIGVKALGLFIRPGVSLPTGKPFIDTLLQVGLHNFDAFFLSADRPITYRSPTMRLTTNCQIELPGGIVQQGETMRNAAIREFTEEVCPAGPPPIVHLDMPLIRDPCPWDGGTHNEWYAIWCMVVDAKPSPEPREGIVPEECECVPLLQARSWLSEQRQRGRCVEGYAFHALDALGLLLTGGWELLRGHAMRGSELA